MRNFFLPFSFFFRPHVLFMREAFAKIYETLAGSKIINMITPLVRFSTQHAEKSGVKKYFEFFSAEIEFRPRLRKREKQKQLDTHI